MCPVPQTTSVPNVFLSAILMFFPNCSKMPSNVFSAEGEGMDRTEDHGRVVTETPGRVRIRLHRPHRHLVHGITAHLKSHEGIRDVVTNPLTGSILVHYDRRALTCNEVLGMCRDIGIVLHGVAEAESESPLEMNQSSAIKSIDTAVVDLDRRVSRVTGQTVNMRMVAPLALGTLGVRHLIVDGLGSISGYVMILLACNSFYRLSRRQRKPKPRQAVPSSVPSPS